jgi:hypothetical protein
MNCLLLNNGMNEIVVEKKRLKIAYFVVNAVFSLFAGHPPIAGYLDEGLNNSRPWPATSENTVFTTLTIL